MEKYLLKLGEVGPEDVREYMASTSIRHRRRSSSWCTCQLRLMAPKQHTHKEKSHPQERRWSSFPTKTSGSPCKTHPIPHLPRSGLSLVWISTGSRRSWRTSKCTVPSQRPELARHQIRTQLVADPSEQGSNAKSISVSRIQSCRQQCNCNGD